TDLAMQVAIANKYPEAVVHIMELMNNYSEVQRYYDRLEANLKNSLCQLQAEIELQLKDKIKYAKSQEFRNMNPTTGLPHVSNTIFKKINDNSKFNVDTSQQPDHKVEFIEDNYKEPQILLNIALEDCSDIQSKSESLSTAIFKVLEKICEQEVNSKIFVESNSKKACYDHGLEICKKVLNIAIMNSTSKILKDLLQHFINEQVLAQSSNNAFEQDISQEIENLIISNLLQHKSKGRPANRRYLSAIENQ
ncbi:36345_t:CDS:2, partial [Racocetra persica]